MSNPLKVLHLEDNLADSDLVRATLEQERINCAIDRVMTKDAFETALQSKNYDIIVSDFSLPGFDGMAALSLAQSLRPEIPFIFLSGTIGEDRAVESLKKGAADYVVKDRMQRLGSAIVRAQNDAAQQRQRREYEEQIRRQAELLNQANDAIFIHDAEEQITYWNKSAERIYGWTADEVIGKKVSDLLYRQGLGIPAEIRKALLEKGVWTGELAHVTKAGKDIIVSNHRTLLRDGAGQTFDLNINTDVTEKKELEAQVLRSQRMDSIGALAGGIAHDLNNMLAPILMATELLRDELQDKQHLRMLEAASTSAKRGADLVKQILQFSRGGPRGVSIVNLRTVEEDVIRFISKIFPPALKIESDVDSDLYAVAGDATQLHQVLLNLCVNARDAMSDAGALTISLKNRRFANYAISGSDRRVSGAFVELSVADTGPGIPPEIRNRIFDPFFTTKPHGKGTGIGLSTVSKIVVDHKGFVEVATTVGKGTTFRVFLPATLQQNAKESEPALVDSPLGNGEWILLVDDESALLEMTKELLEANNYKVITATNGVEALHLFESHRDKISVVISDLLMPGMGGKELLGTISERLPKILTICLSGSADETVFLRKDERGPTAFVRKPCSATTLLNVLGKLLAERKPQHSEG